MGVNPERGDALSSLESEIKNSEDFNKEMGELMSYENQIEFDKIGFDDLDLKTAKIKDLMKIEFLFI